MGFKFFKYETNFEKVQPKNVSEKKKYLSNKGKANGRIKLILKKIYVPGNFSKIFYIIINNEIIQPSTIYDQ